MKIKFLILALSVFNNCSSISSFAGTESKTPDEQVIAQALTSNDVQTVIEIIPNIEKLWPEQLEIYLQSVRKAANVLGGSTNNSSAKLALLDLFSNMIQKPFPTNGDLAVPCLNEKDDIILYYFNFDEVRNNKSRLMAVAKYIGEIRDQIIPNFIPKTVYLNPPGAMDSSPEKVKKAIQENEKNKAINSYQQSLHEANSILTFHLLHSANRFTSSDPTNTEFIQMITSSAHLSADEQRQLQ